MCVHVYVCLSMPACKHVCLRSWLCSWVCVLVCAASYSWEGTRVSEGALESVFARERRFSQRLSEKWTQKNQEMPATALEPQSSEERNSSFFKTSEVKTGTVGATGANTWLSQGAQDGRREKSWAWKGLKQSLWELGLPAHTPGPSTGRGWGGLGGRAVAWDREFETSLPYRARSCV